MAEKKEHPKKHDTPYTDEPGAGKKPPKRDKEAETPYTDESGAGEIVEHDEATPYTDESGAGKTVERDEETDTPYTENS
jgi:hypothetical protein